MRLKFGKFKGQSLEEIVNEQEGQGYLMWLRDNTETTGKYAKQNKQMIAEIDEVLGSATAIQDQPPRPASPRPAAAPAASGAATVILQQIAKTLQNIEKILANPKQVHIAENEMTADENIPF